MKDLAGKTAFVTGAASGIGLGVATSLAQTGVKVMLCDIEEAALERALAGLRATNADVDGVKADVSLKAELQAAADATAEANKQGRETWRDTAQTQKDQHQALSDAQEQYHQQQREAEQRAADAAKAGNRAGSCTKHRRFALGDPLREHPAQSRRCGRNLSHRHCHTGTSVCGHSRAGVEPKPANPKQ